MTHYGSGIVLRTSINQKENRILRTIFDKKCVYYQTITDYVPPLFMVINYEEAAFTRSTLDNTINADWGSTLRTDELLHDNIGFVESLLVSADCQDYVIQFTFLRLETVYDYQRHFEKLYPLWSVGVGALSRVTFSNWQKRDRALKVLTSNAATNQDVYTINNAANRSVVTIIDYLEPLFAYCKKLETETNYPMDPQKQMCNSTVSAVTNNGSARNASVTAATNTSEMFVIDFCLIDEPVDHEMDKDAQQKSQQHIGDNESVASSCSVSDITTNSKRTSSAGRKRRGTNTTATDTMNADYRKRVKRYRTLVAEKPRAIHGSLSVHDVRPYFSMLHSRRLSRLSLDQLEELPVVAIHCERHFCVTTCCVVNRVDNSLSVLHVYYCWEKEVHDFLSVCADSWNRMGGVGGRKNTDTLVAVSKLCPEDVEARLKMLEDLKNVIWKDNVQAYVRLAINDKHDENMVARNFYEPLVFCNQRTSADLETEIRRSVSVTLPSGSLDMFQNSITLDCACLCEGLDKDNSDFAKAYHRLMDDTCSLETNAYVRIDSQSLKSAERKNEAFRLLEHRQELYARIVTEFRSERVLETAFDMASELRVGLLDVFGTRYTEQQRTPSLTFKSLDKASSTSYDLFDSARASNCVFVETLLGASMYFGTSGATATCNEFFTEDKRVKPIANSTPGLYRGDMIEFDLKSAYPSVAVLYNISPETTAIVDRDSLKRLDEHLKAFVSNDKKLDTIAQDSVTDTLNVNKKNNKRHRSDVVVTSIYNRIGYVDDECSNLVIISLRPEIYVGCLARVMETLVLKRNSRNKLMDTFYKKLANVVYGCTGKATPFNDLFSQQCQLAIVSLCKSVMLRTLQNVPPETILFSQTDGALLLGVVDERPSCKQLEETVKASISDIVLDVNNVSTSVKIVPRVRQVDTCLLRNQNQYLILYSDGRAVSKGQQPQLQRSVSSYLTESLLTTMSLHIRDKLNSSNPSALELDCFMASCFNHIEVFNSNSFIEWFVTLRIPSTNGHLYNERNQRALTGLGPDDFFSTDRLVDTTVTRFGDTIAIWPVLVRNDENVYNEYRVYRPFHNDALRPDYIYVMKPFLLYWVRQLFTTCYPHEDEKRLRDMFNAICRKRRNELLG